MKFYTVNLSSSNTNSFISFANAGELSTSLPYANLTNSLGRRCRALLWEMWCRYKTNVYIASVIWESYRSSYPEETA
ncbi:hypothetical protein DPMN_190918 [Dreissena polymorpha]|uniref:Uncharacterized protein n=1 Tax=Dreissena polymorpha TaxID=45954 RepID=A0A9D4B6S1_DREPO|nr:hypothetical protein DPMN_190918 [Dreissena polymorpha]